MYQLSRAYELEAKPEKALEVLDKLVSQYPSSKWTTEAQFRRGEILFSASRYREAENAYSAVIKARSRQRLLRARFVQTRLVVVQTKSRRRKRRVVLEGDRSRARRGRQVARREIRCNVPNAS